MRFNRSIESIRQFPTPSHFRLFKELSVKTCFLLQLYHYSIYVFHLLKVEDLFYVISRIFNTNNLWVRLSAIKRLLDAKKMHMEVIVNNKVSVE